MCRVVIQVHVRVFLTSEPDGRQWPSSHAAILIRGKGLLAHLEWKPGWPPYPAGFSREEKGFSFARIESYFLSHPTQIQDAKKILVLWFL
jgi:hypothetical protein